MAWVGRLIEHHSLVLIDQHAMLQVPLHRPRERLPLQITPLAQHIFHRVSEPSRPQWLFEKCAGIRKLEELVFRSPETGKLGPFCPSSSLFASDCVYVQVLAIFASVPYFRLSESLSPSVEHQFTKAMLSRSR